MRRPTVAALAGAVACAACFPVLTHGPTVKPGFDLTIGSVLNVVTGDASNVVPIPWFDVGAAVGVTPERWNGGGFRVNAQTSLLYGSLDVYAQFPRTLTGPMNAGAGAVLVAGSRTGIIPYFMIGLPGGLYVSQGLASVRTASTNPLNSLSVTTLGYEASSRRGLNLFATALIGHQTRCRPGEEWFCLNAYAPVAMIGMTAAVPPPRRRRGGYPPVPPPGWPPPRPRPPVIP